MSFLSIHVIHVIHVNSCHSSQFSKSVKWPWKNVLIALFPLVVQRSLSEQSPRRRLPEVWVEFRSSATLAFAERSKSWTTTEGLRFCFPLLSLRHRRGLTSTNSCRQKGWTESKRWRQTRETQGQLKTVLCENVQKYVYSDTTLTRPVKK